MKCNDCRANFPILYRNLWYALRTATDKALESSVGDASKFKVWHLVCSTMSVLTNIIKQHAHRANYQAYIKVSYFTLIRVASFCSYCYWMYKVCDMHLTFIVVHALLQQSMDVIQLTRLLHPFIINTITPHNVMKFQIPYSYLLKLSSLWPVIFCI
jgi:hypothetical protein